MFVTDSRQIRQQEVANFTERVEQAILRTTLDSGSLKAHIVSVALAKYDMIADFISVSCAPMSSKMIRAALE